MQELNLNRKNTYKFNCSYSLFFPTWEFSASMSFLLALPSSFIWSIHCFKPSYADISSYTLNHFLLNITSYGEKDQP